MPTTKSELCKCAHCQGRICYPNANMDDRLPAINEAPRHCPMRRYTEIIHLSTGSYHKENVREFARLASIQEAECYERTENGGLRTRLPRIEEIIGFAKKLDYTRLGLAFCIGLREEARMTSRIIENKGFQVSSVGCKIGRMPKETIGISGEEKITGPERMEPLCNPIAQAQILNAEEVDMVVMLGLCVGHDTLFFKYTQRPVTVLAVKDRVTGHNPLAALYLARSPYYNHLREQEEKSDTGKGEGWKKIDIMHEE